MKVIDILLDIANGEEVPTKIKVYNDIYEYDTFNKSYWNKQHKNLLELYNGYILNYEVEIIEDKTKEEIQVLSRWYPPKEDKKIEKLDLEFDDGFIKEHFIGSSVSYLSEYTTLKMLYEKQCEIIDKINGE